MATGLGGAPSSSENRATSAATCFCSEIFWTSYAAHTPPSACPPDTNSLTAVAPLAS